MTIESMKQTTFEQATSEEWEQVALKSLKNKPLESLSTTTLEEILLKPLYTMADVQDISPNQTTIVREAKSSGWKVAQVATGNSSDEILKDIKSSLEKGNDMIYYIVDSNHTWSSSQLEELKALTDNYPVLLDASEDSSFLSNLPAFQGLVKGAQDVAIPNARHYFLDGSALHKKGADAVGELVSVLVQADAIVGTTNLETLEEKGFVQFSMDTNFFMEIAKIRAFRILWKAFGEAHGKSIAFIPVHVETSLRSFSALDEHVNILRAGNSALAAVLGGADSVTTYPHDYLTETSETSNRIARNMQLVLKEETHIKRILDAAGGSYYIESLTKELVEKSWDYFVELMQLESLEERVSLLEERATKKWEQQLTDIAKRKKSLIGTNTYANPQDTITKTRETDYARLAEPFEKMRKMFHEQPLQAAIIPYGLLREYKGRLDFVNGFLVSIGIQAIVAPENLKPYDLREWIDRNGIQYVVFVGNDEQTAGLVPAILNEQLSIPMDVAGKFDEYEDWLEAGLSGRIYAGQSLIEKGKELLAIANKEDSLK